MKKFLSLMMLCLMILSPVAIADSASQAVSDANSTAKAAQEFVAQALKILVGTPDRTKMELALSLYAKAGELFERSYKAYVALGPNYATSQDVDGARAAMENCMKNIGELRRRLQ